MLRGAAAAALAVVAAGLAAGFAAGFAFFLPLRLSCPYFAMMPASQQKTKPASQQKKNAAPKKSP